MSTIGCVQHDCEECKAREAQTVEPVADEQAIFEAWIERARPSGDGEAVQREWEASGDYADFIASNHPAPPPSGERAALINLLKQGASISRDRNINLDFAKVADQAADMLAADADQLSLYEGTLESRDRNIADLLSENKQLIAQQVAVPKGWYHSDAELAALLGEIDQIQQAELKNQTAHQKERVRVLRAECIALNYKRISMLAAPKPPQGSEKCWCETCRPIALGEDMRMVLCPVCGNKRCPHANDHRNACTGSNDVGQAGSSWEHVKPFVAQAQELTDSEIYEWWREDNGLEDCDMCKLFDFTKAVRAFEAYCAARSVLAARGAR